MNIILLIFLNFSLITGYLIKSNPLQLGNLTPEKSPFTVNVLTLHNATSNLSVLVGNDKFTMNMGSQYGTKLLWKKNAEDEPVDLIGDAVGLYTSYTLTKEHDINYTSIHIVEMNDNKIDISFDAWEGELHLVLFKGLDGFYSYFVNFNLPLLGEFRTLIRLNPEIYQNGHTSIKDDALPTWPLMYEGEKVFDETWMYNDEYITKYDWSSRLHEESIYGVHGNNSGKSYGFWLLSPGRDYYCGDQIKQELLIHRESKTGDVVLLNMLHGTHFEGDSFETFEKNKVWGPYLWYFNDGSISDVNRRMIKENFNWPYKWFNNQDYLNRGHLKGRLLLPNGSPASNVNLFLGYNNNYTMVQGAEYQYYGYTDEEGYFDIKDIRIKQDYYLQAYPSEWSSKTTDIGDVISNFTYSGIIKINKDKYTDLGTLKWQDQKHKTIWQIGTFDRTTKGFKLGDSAYQDMLPESCPGDFDFYINNSSDADWCYAKSKNGTWNIHFELEVDNKYEQAGLFVSLAGYTGLNETYLGGDSDKLQVFVNDKQLSKDSNNVVIKNDKSTYRSSSFAGNWYYSKLLIDKKDLINGNNVIALVTNNYTANYGIMWDSLKLAWI